MYVFTEKLYAHLRLMGINRDLFELAASAMPSQEAVVMAGAKALYASKNRAR